MQNSATADPKKIFAAYDERLEELNLLEQKALATINEVSSIRKDLKTDLFNAGLYTTYDDAMLNAGNPKESIGKGQILRIEKVEKFLVSGIYVIRDQRGTGALLKIDFYDNQTNTYNCSYSNSKFILKLKDSEITEFYKVVAILN